MRRTLVLLAFSAALVAAFAGCGGSDTTTITEAVSTEATTKAAPSQTAAQKQIARIEQETQEAELEAARAKKNVAQQKAQVKKAAAKSARQAAAKVATAEAQVEDEETSSEPPDVIGMRLPAAEAELSAAGFRTLAENTDTTFGIMVPSHYTVCTETPLGGDTVEVLAQKYGC
jgi:hypothetical protein